MIMSDEQISPPILVRVFFWTLLSVFCLFLGMDLFKTSQIYNFKTRLGEICSSDVNAKGCYHGSLTLQPLKCIPLVVIDNRERK